MIDLYHINPEHIVFAYRQNSNFLEALNAGWYKRVCTVTTDDLEKVWELTQNIEKPWTREDYRSTMVGDIAIRGNYIYVVAGMGFTLIGNLDTFPVHAA